MIGDTIKVDVNAVRLQQAVLCANCDVISDSLHDSCLIRGSHSLMPLARVLNNANALKIEQQKQQPSLLDNVLVLESPVAHRRSRRARR